MSTWHPNRLLTGYGWDALTAACLLAPRPPESMLLLGLGGGTIVRQLLHLLPNLAVTAVDLNPKALQVASTNLGSLAGLVKMIEADAYQWLADCRQQFDAVVDDVYAAGAEDVFRPIPLGRQLTKRLQARTTPGGVVVANLITGCGHHLPHLQARSAFLAAFPQVRTVRPELGFNAVLVGATRLLPASSLGQWRDSWPARDRVRWDRLRVARGR